MNNGLKMGYAAGFQPANGFPVVEQTNGGGGTVYNQPVYETQPIDQGGGSQPVYETQQTDQIIDSENGNGLKYTNDPETLPTETTEQPATQKKPNWGLLLLIGLGIYLLSKNK